MKNSSFYYKMYLIRRFEETLLQMFDKGLLSGTTHTYIGQEHIAVSYIDLLNKETDIIFSNHRCHGHFIAYSDKIYELACEIMGRVDGVCKGVGGSQHLHYNNFYSNGIQGGIVANATGCALAEKEMQSTALTTVFLGDGTLGEGLVYESFNLASLWKIPIVYLVENNQYAQSTPVSMQLSGSIAKRFEAFAIEVNQFDSSDPVYLNKEFSNIINKARSERKPQAIIVETYRLANHSKSDDFRDQKEVDSFKKKDPLFLFRNELDPLEVKEIETEVDKLIIEAFEKAEKSPLTKDISYALS